MNLGDALPPGLSPKIRTKKKNLVTWLEIQSIIYIHIYIYIERERDREIDSFELRKHNLTYNIL